MKKKMYKELISNARVLNGELDIVLTFEKVETNKIYVFYVDEIINKYIYKDVHVSI